MSSEPRIILSRQTERPRCRAARRCCLATRALSACRAPIADRRAQPVPRQPRDRPGSVEAGSLACGARQRQRRRARPPPRSASRAAPDSAPHTPMTVQRHLRRTGSTEVPEGFRLAGAAHAGGGSRRAHLISAARCTFADSQDCRCALGLDVLVLANRESSRLRLADDQDRLSTLCRKSIPSMGLRASARALFADLLK